MSDIKDLLQKRYLHPGEEGWTDVSSRVAKFLYPDDETQRGFLFHALNQKEFIPSSPVLMNAGARYPMMCSCFVLPVEDNIEAIMRTLTNTVLIQKYGGGVGINFSPIRPDGSVVNSTNGRASGPVSFMGFWNAGMNIIRQGGKRQGAMMGVLDVNHPDLPLFLDAKTVEGQLTNFNLSVGLDANFMLKVLRGDEKANVTLDQIAEHAWKNGEPGVLYLDNINIGNPYGQPIYATNPCGEVPLPPYGACCLGSINLNACLTKNEYGYAFNYETFRRLIHIGVDCLNQVIEKSWWPVAAVTEFMEEYRPIGLGVMGLADVLIKLGLAYDSVEGRDFVGQIMDFLESDTSFYSGGRNATQVSIAPTGTISMLAGCSYSIEPHFAYRYMKTTEAGEFDGDGMDLVRLVAKRYGYTLTTLDALSIALAGSVQHTGMPDEAKVVLKTANEIDPIDHLLMQSAVQRHTDNGVSKTINLPSTATVAAVRNIIVKGHAQFLKGLTVYRDRSREVQVITPGCASGKCEQ